MFFTIRSSSELSFSFSSYVSDIRKDFVILSFFSSYILNFKSDTFLFYSKSIFSYIFCNSSLRTSFWAGVSWHFFSKTSKSYLLRASKSSKCLMNILMMASEKLDSEKSLVSKELILLLILSIFLYISGESYNFSLEGKGRSSIAFNPFSIFYISLLLSLFIFF